MKEILVLQNCRMGDILQCTTMLRGLKEKYPHCRVSMIVNTLFSEIKFDPDVLDEMISFDQNSMYEYLKDESTSLVDKYNFTKAFVEKFKGRQYDLIINLPSEDNGHTLATILYPLAKEVRGGLFTPDRVLIIRHPSIVMFYTVPKIREFNRFNLVDHHNLVGEVNPTIKRLNFSITPEGTKFADSFFKENNIIPGDFVVALQPGASEERKRWTPASFGQLAQRLIRELGAKVIICGAKSENHLAEAIARSCPEPIISAAGKTTLPGLATILQRCSILVSNDTGTMHLAKAMGTRVIDLSTGPVHFRETGPYGEGDLIVQGDIPCFPCNFDAICNHLSCRDLITADMVFKLAKALKENISFESLDPNDFKGVKIYTNYFTDIGRLETAPIFKYEISHNEVLSYLYANLMEVSYKLRARPVEMAEIFAHIDRHFTMSNRRDMTQECERSLSYFRQLSGLLARGIHLLKNILGATENPKPGAPITQMIQEVQSISDRSYVLGCAYSQLRPLTLYLKLITDSQEEGSLEQIAGEYLKQYQWVANQSDFMIASLEVFVQLMNNGRYQPYALTG